MLSKNDWIVTIDISDAYLTIPLDEEFKDHVAISGSDLPISVHAFRPKQCREGLHKTMKHPVAIVRALGFKVLVYLDDWILAAQARFLCLKQSRFLVNFLQKLGFRINLEISSPAPSQIKEWLGFIIDSRSMTISLPQRKIDNLIEKAQGLKGKMREISQFLGLRNSSKPAVLQAPLHYCSIQRLLIGNLRRFLNPYQSDYLTVVTLDTPSIQDLDWWIQEMKFNCTRKICPPPPPPPLPAKCSNIHRLQRFRMGCHSKSGQTSRLMESVGLAHQYSLISTQVFRLSPATFFAWDMRRVVK